MKQRLVGFVLIAAGIAAGVLWATGRIAHPFAPVAGLFLLLLGATSFGKASRLADELRPLRGKAVSVRVWGSALPGRTGCKFQVHKIWAFGAGVHLYLRPLPDGSPVHLKIAQPLRTVVGDAGLEVSKAKYVEWAGKKMNKDEREKALVLAVEE